MSKVILENIGKVYSGEKGREMVAVHDANLTIENGEFMVFVGPSGCGKSTTLRMIAGLEEISHGRIFIDGRCVNDVPPKDRDIAMVFQNYALYPHMSVRQNMAFGLQLRKYPRAEIDQRVREAAQILGLTGEMLQRKPKALSGGQRQRVALGRAIVRKPKVFLFDEPLSNLDAKMRVQMRTEISKLHQQLQTTMIYVTHDQVEAMTMGDRICLMKDGRILQVDEPLGLYNRPANMFVAAFIGSPPMNFFQGTVVAKGGRLYFSEKKGLDENGLTFLKIDEAHGAGLASLTNQRVVLGLRPEDLEIRSGGDATACDSSHVFKAQLEVAESLGSETCMYLTTGTHSFVARIQSQVREKMGQIVELRANMAKAHFFAPADVAFFRDSSGNLDLERWQAGCPLIV